MDILHHFGLADLPFAPIADPATAWNGGPYAIARGELLARLARGERVIALAGAPGAGKTLLLHAIERTLAGEGRNARRFNDAGLVGCSPAPGDVLIVDEADKLDSGLLAALADTTPPGAAILFAGDEGTIAKLAPSVVAVRLPYLIPAEACAFLSDRLDRVGAAHLFAPRAIDTLVAAGAGSPRRLGMLAGGAMLHAMLDEAAVVDRSHVAEAVSMNAGLAGATRPTIERMPEPRVAPSEETPPPVVEIVEARARRGALAELLAQQEGALAASIAIGAAAAGLALLATVASQTGGERAARPTLGVPAASARTAAPLAMAPTTPPVVLPAAVSPPSAVAQAAPDPMEQAALTQPPARTAPVRSARPLPTREPPADRALASVDYTAGASAAPPIPTELAPEAAPARPTVETASLAVPPSIDLAPPAAVEPAAPVPQEMRAQARLMREVARDTREVVRAARFARGG